MVVGFHAVDTVQPFLCGEQRMLSNDGPAGAIEVSAQGFPDLPHGQVELATDELVIFVFDASGFFIQRDGLAFDQTMQERIAWHIKMFDHHTFEFGLVAARHFQQHLALECKPVAHIAVRERR
ncbi:hypothetical protein D3C85_1494750 [compost metagenome]